jgi:hypothetical protein
MRKNYKDTVRHILVFQTIDYTECPRSRVTDTVLTFRGNTTLLTARSDTEQLQKLHIFLATNM